MEIEFLINDNKIYFIEINPRVSGIVRSDFYIIEEKKINKNMYIEKIIMPYIKTVTNN